MFATKSIRSTYRQLKNYNATQMCQLIQCQAYETSAKLPNLTKDRYPVERGNFSEITEKDIAKFQSIIEPSRIVTDEDECLAYNVDFIRTVRGSSRLILKPKTTQEVSEILKYCNERKLAVCPQSGNTGLVGGSVPVFDEIILSLKLMNKVEKIDEYMGIMVCQAGCVLENLEAVANEKGLVVPLDLGAKGSCLIGGNVSTNAGGLRLVRYGNLHGSVLGVEAVTATGKILDLMSNFKKDNTGYHLKHLFIGSEGTLGVVTRLAMFLPTAPKAISVAFLGLESYDSVMKTFLAAKRDLGEILSSCEMIDSASFQKSVEVNKFVAPLQSKYPFYMLIETSGSRSDHDEEKLNDFLESSMTRGEVLDGTVTNEPSKIKYIWQIREQIATALIKDSYCFKYDLSLPLSHFYEIVPAIAEQVGDLATVVCGYGHIGDANLHLNISCPEYTKEIHDKLEPFVYEYTSKLKGSISAEHGVGFIKSKYLKYSKSPEAISMMKELKGMMDPNGILNPYKVFY